jgi:hypothetical protein
LWSDGVSPNPTKGRPDGPLLTKLNVGVYDIGIAVSDAADPPGDSSWMVASYSPGATPAGCCSASP